MPRVLVDEGFTSPVCYRQSGSTNISTTAAVVEFDTVEIHSDRYSLSAGVIKMLEPGIYFISYGVPINDDGIAGATRGRVFAWVEKNGVAVSQSKSQTYARETSGGQGVSAGFLVDVSANDSVRLLVQSSSSVDVSTEIGETQISAYRVAKSPE